MCDLICEKGPFLLKHLIIKVLIEAVPYCKSGHVMFDLCR